MANKAQWGESYRMTGKNGYSFFCLTAFFSFFSGHLQATGQAPSCPAKQKIDSDVVEIMQRTEAPGASFMAIGEHATCRGFYGFRDREKKIPVDAETHFEIGSITKQFTAAAILQLRESHKLDLDAKLSVFLPDAPHANEVTLRQLLSHTSGMPEYLAGSDINDVATRAITYESLIGRVGKKPLDFEPGSRWAYSNTGYILLGRVIEVVSHETYRHYVQTHLLDRAGMRQTFTVADEHKLPDMAVGYWIENGHVVRAPTIHDSFGWAAGNLVSTLDDLEKWNRALAGGRIVSSSDYASMIEANRTDQNQDTGYGLGLFVGRFEGELRIGHTGGSFGFTSANENFPELGARVIVLTNKGGSPETGEMIADAVFNRLYPEINRKHLAADPGEDAAVTGVARKLFASIQDGRPALELLGRSLGEKMQQGLASRLNAQFDPYGKPTAFVFKGRKEEGNLIWHSYLILFGPGNELLFGVAIDETGKVSKISNG